MLPDPNHLKRWELLGNDSCGLCLIAPVSVHHIMTGCAVALKKGRYRWRHDQVMSTVKEAIVHRKGNKSSYFVWTVSFLKPGERLNHIKLGKVNHCTGLY